MKKQQVEALRREVEVARAVGGQPRYSVELRRGVVALLRDPEWGPSRVSRELGLAESILHRWAKGKPVRKSRPSGVGTLTKVDVVANSGGVSKTYELTFASGAKVAGLTWDEISSLVRGGR